MVINRRSEIEIIGQILNISRGGVKKTEILYQSNLSYMQLQSYLPFLLEKNILEEYTVENNGCLSKMYRITEKGSYLLDYIDKVLMHLE